VTQDRLTSYPAKMLLLIPV